MFNSHNTSRGTRRTRRASIAAAVCGAAAVGLAAPTGASAAPGLAPAAPAAAPSAESNMFHPDCNYQYYVTSPVMRDGCVTRMQNILNLKGAKLTVDGEYDTTTEAAMKKFKVSVGLSSSGLVGPQTKLELEFATGLMRDRVLAYGLKAYNGDAMGTSTTGVWNGGHIRYSFNGTSTYGGGHGAKPGPSNLDYYRTPNPSSGVLDCSGFTRWAHALAYGYSGKSNPHGNWDTKSIRANVTRSTSVRAGDLIVWRNASNTAGHVAIYMGGGQIVHSTSAGSFDGVSITSVSWVDSGYPGGSKTYHRF